MDSVVSEAVSRLVSSEATPKSGIPNDGDSDMRIVLDSVPSKYTLQSLIGGMGEYLQNEDGAVRRRATGVLAALLRNAVATNSYAFLVEKNDVVRVLTTFFLSRLGDYPSALPSLKAVRALLAVVHGQHTVYPSAAISIAKSIFSNLNTQAMDQSHRQAVYAVFDDILSSRVHIAALLGKPVSLGSDTAPSSSMEPYILDFASGFIQAIDGEKDPRCLLVCLRCAAALLDSHGPDRVGDSISSLYSDMIDVTACYFPITFTPPPNDPHGITREMLSGALRKVFTSNAALSGYVLPVVLDKLGSLLPDSKREALVTLRAVAPVYGVQGLAPYLMDICSLLRKEVTQSLDRENPGANATGTVTGMASLWTGTVGGPSVPPGQGSQIGVTAGAIGLNFSGSSDLHVNSGYGLYVPLSLTTSSSTGSSAGGPAALPLVEEALHTIAGVTRVLATASQTADGVAPQWWTDYTAYMVKTSITEVERAAESLMGRSCARILCAVAAANHIALRTVLNMAMPTLKEIAEDAATNCRHAVHASVLACVAGLVHAVNPVIDHPAGEHPLAKHKLDMLTIFTRNLRMSSSEGNISAAQQPRVAGVAPLTEARCIAAAGVCDLCVRPPTPLLQLEEKHALTSLLAHILVQDGDDTVREASLRALCTLASIRTRFCDAVLRLAVPSLMANVRGTAAVQPTGEGQLPQDADAAQTGLGGPGLHVPVQHAQGVADIPSRALYALSQLCAISAARVQMTVLPQLMDVAIGLEEAEDVDGRSVSVMRLRAYPASLPSATPVSLSTAVIEAIARLVFIKAQVDDTAALDELLKPSEQAKTIWAAVDEKQPLQALVPTLYRLLVDSVRPGCVRVLPRRVVAAVEQIFRNVSVCASTEAQAEFRAAIVRSLLQGTPSAAQDVGCSLYSPAPWFTPLVPGAAVHQARLLPVYLKVIACHRKGIATAQSLQLAEACIHACFSLDVGVLRSCSDSRQRTATAARAVLIRGGPGGDEEAEESNAAAKSPGVSAEGENGHPSEDAHEGTLHGGMKPASPRGGGDLFRGAVLCAQTVGLLVNREPPGQQLDTLISAVADLITKRGGIQLSSPSSPSQAKPSQLLSAGVLEKGIVLAVWFAKGLAMRGHAYTTRAVDAILAVLEGAMAPSLLSLLGSALGCLVMEAVPRHPFSKESGAVMVGTYKQRVFAQIMGKYRDSMKVSGDQSSNYVHRLPLLLGLCSMAAYLPSALLCHEVDKLIPVAVQALDLVTTKAALPWELRDTVGLSAISTIRTLVVQPEGAAALHVHLPSLVDALLVLSRYVPRPAGQVEQAGPKPMVRASAIDCLRCLVAPAGTEGGAAAIPYGQIHPVRQRVISGLLTALDDPRRPVRRRAAACRNDWITMPGGDPTKHR